GIPKEGGKVRQLSIPAIRDRVVQGALKLILEPIFEADFQPGSFGYRPKQSAHAAVRRVAQAIVQGKTYVIDLDLRSFFDTVRHHIVLAKVARRVSDEAVLWLLRLLLKASGRLGVPQGGVISPLLSNVYLNEVDIMLERAQAVTRDQQWTRVVYARFADDLVVLVDAHPRHTWLRAGGEARTRVAVSPSRKANASVFWVLSSVGFAVVAVDGCRGARRKTKSGRRCCGRSSPCFEVLGPGPIQRGLRA